MTKKLTALILCLLLMLTLAPAALADGETVIMDRAGLEAISDDPGGDYILGADIDLAGEDWYPIEFSGHLNGNGHYIYNMNVTAVNETSYETQDGNHKKYDTYFAGLFSKTTGAIIKDLNLLGVNIDIHSDDHVFIGGIVGYGQETYITGCSVSGRLSVYMSAQMFGAGGIEGYGSGKITSCSVDVTVTTADENKEIKSEGFLGGIVGCGYNDIWDCDIKMTSYVSLDGYMHSGGIIGMHHIDDQYLVKSSAVKNNTVDADMFYYEHNDDPRYYCYFDFGERLNPYLAEENNTEEHFEKEAMFTEDQEPTRILSPEECDEPEYETAVTPPTEEEFGYTTYTCKTCGYTYVADYTVPIHVEAIAISEKTLALNYRDSASLTAAVTPEGADDPSYTWQSSDPQVCTVDENGAVKATGRGEAVITCTTTDGGFTDSCDVTVDYTTGQWLKIILLFGWIWYI